MQLRHQLGRGLAHGGVVCDHELSKFLDLSGAGLRSPQIARIDIYLVGRHHDRGDLGIGGRAHPALQG